MYARSVDVLPTYDRVLFPAANLELALVQVKFPPLPRFDEHGYLNGFKEALAEDYPLPTAEHALNVLVTPQGVSQQLGARVYRFSSLDHGWAVMLSSDTVTLESRTYRDITEFSGRFCAILERFSTTLKPRHQLRFGLRYVNEFRRDPEGDSYETWARLLNPELLGPGARNIFGGTIQQTISELRTDRTDGSLLLRHGFLEGTTVAPTPARRPKSGRFYLLDLDYFDEHSGDFNPHPVDRMFLYNEFLYRVFRWCVGDGELYRQLQGSL